MMSLINDITVTNVFVTGDKTVNNNVPVTNIHQQYVTVTNDVNV